MTPQSQQSLLMHWGGGSIIFEIKAMYKTGLSLALHVTITKAMLILFNVKFKVGDSLKFPIEGHR